MSSNCEVCGKEKRCKTLSQVTICEECFFRLQRLRNGDKDEVLFFRNRDNMPHASERGAAYVMEIAQKKYIEYCDSEKAKREEKTTYYRRRKCKIGS